MIAKLIYKKLLHSKAFFYSKFIDISNPNI